MFTPDTTLLERLLLHTDFPDDAAAYTAEWELRRRADVIDAATIYVRSLTRLNMALSELAKRVPADTPLPESIAAFLRGMR